MTTDIATFDARLDTLQALLEWIEQACAEAGVGEETGFSLLLAAEEVCANVIRHGYANRQVGPIRLGFHGSEHEVALTIEDDAPVFDPTKVSSPDLAAGWEDRRIGGLGWHLVYQLVDVVRHEPLPHRGNRITLIKRRINPAHPVN